MENRIVTTINISEDSEIEYGLRPTKLRDYVGQRKVK